jgi:ADP-heptose:LPS heptosyltransferase
VVVHPGASVPARAWLPQRHRALVAALAGQGRNVVVTGDPSERELTAFVAGSGTPEVVDLGGRTTLPGLAEVMAAARVVIAGNTGPAHLAAAVGTPVVSLYAPTVPAVRWRPWGVPHVVLGRQDIPCAGCRARLCPFDDHPCLDVTVAEVIDAIDSLTGEPRTANSTPELAGVLS